MLKTYFTSQRDSVIYIFKLQRYAMFCYVQKCPSTVSLLAYTIYLRARHMLEKLIYHFPGFFIP